MKRLLFLILVLQVNHSAWSQQPFEGRIDYLLTSRDSTVQLFISGFFGEQQIFVNMKVLKAPAAGMNVKDEKILLDFKTGFINRIHDSLKTINRDPLTGPKAKRDLPPLVRTKDTMSFLGQQAIAYTSPVISKEETKDSVKIKMSAEVKIWYATDLIFNVPDSMAMVQMIPLFTNGHVALGSTIQLDAGPMKLSLSTRAVEIRRGKLGPSVFRLPEGYKIETED